MRRLVLGTAGHIDHGKTTLVRALTGVDTDRLPEEKRRGITIDLGFASLPLTPDLQLAIVDVPGHEAFIRNMVAGATGIDLALLVVAADEGVMPQTREHLAIVDLLGVRAGVVALTKCDLVDPEWLDLVVEELGETLGRTGFAGAPVVPVSATTGVGLDRLREALLAAAATEAEPGDDDLFRLPVDRVFTIRGTGTVATGTVWSGALRDGEAVRILPLGETARVRGLQMHGEQTGEIFAGARAAVALAGVDREDAGRGATLVTDAAWETAGIITARVRMLASSPRPLRSRQPIRLHLGTVEAMGRMKVLESGGEIAPGATGWAQIRFGEPIVARAGDRFVLRSFSPVETIGGGVVAEPAAGKRKRLDDEARQRLSAVLDGDQEAAVLAAVELTGEAGLQEKRLPLVTPYAPSRVQAALTSLADRVVRVGERIVEAEHLSRAGAAVREAVAAVHQREPLRAGAERAELRRMVPEHAAPGLADAAIDRLLGTGEIELRGGLIATAGFRVRLDASLEALRTRILDLLEQGGISPPVLGDWSEELRSDAHLRELLRLLEAGGEVIALGPDLYLHPTHYDRAVRLLTAALAPGEPRSASELRESLGVSRKYLIPLLEHFDRVRITRRVGDKRLLAGT